MLDFAPSFLAWTASTSIPAFLGLLAIIWANKHVSSTYLAAFGLGIFLWFFLDTIGSSADLDVNSGFRGGVAQVVVVLLFLFGLSFFIWADRNRAIFLPESAMGKYGMVIPVLVAGAVGIHGLGEGAAFGATAFSTTSGSLLDAFGGVTAGVAYVLHKALEPMMIGACYCIYSKSQSGISRKVIKDIFLLTTIFIVTSLLGAATGYFLVYDTTYFFAFGTGTSIYAALRLAGPLFIRDNASPKASFRLAAAIMLGFIAIYFAALFHS